MLRLLYSNPSPFIERLLTRTFYRWFDQDKDPKTSEKAGLFRFIEGFRYDTIRSEATGQPNGREEWMLNTHAALLLGEKDLQLSRCRLFRLKANLQKIAC